MKQFRDKSQGEEEVYEVNTFPVPFTLRENHSNLTIQTNTPSKPSKEQIIYQAIQLHLKGRIPEAAKCYQYCINQGFNDYRVFSNYAGILQSTGKIKEAEIYTRKAIELNPDLAEGHSNLGNILRDLGKLKEAEIYTRKAIELNPDLAEGHSNLGNILRDLDKLKEAVISYRKAIQLKSDFVEAHFNLGNTLRDLGKLQDAEYSYRKAIELNPDFAIAHLNLGNIMRDLGKLEELIIFSKSFLKSRHMNQEYRLLATLEITIANLLLGDFSETFLNINRSKELISKGAIETIKDEQNRTFSSSYFKLITKLLPLLAKENKIPNLKKIPHIGESHCLSFAHQNVSISSQAQKIQPVLIIGGKAWHFAINKNNQWKYSLTQQIKNHTYSNKVLISFGEIDCRKDEGILTYSIKHNKNILTVCEKTIKGYLNYMEKMLSPNYSKRYYFGVPAPTRGKELIDELDIKRIEMVKIYNSLLKRNVLAKGSYFLDVYALTSNKDGENNNLHMCDKFHLSPNCLSILFKDYLIH